MEEVGEKQKKDFLYFTTNKTHPTTLSSSSSLWPGFTFRWEEEETNQPPNRTQKIVTLIYANVEEEGEETVRQ